jgi:hypothetical protein
MLIPLYAEIRAAKCTGAGVYSRSASERHFCTYAANPHAPLRLPYAIISFMSPNSLLFPALATFAACFCAALSSAATVEVLTLDKSTALLKIDGRAARTLRVGELTREGVHLRGITRTGEAQLRIRGIDETLAAGRTVVVSPNNAGLPQLAIPKDTEGRFLAQFLALGQPFQVEVDPNRGGGLVMPAADADRMRLPYKDPEPIAGEPKKAKEFARPQRLVRKGKPYFNHFPTIKNVKVGGIDLFGVRAIVSEDPELKRATAGRDFLLLMDTTWEGSTLTVRRLP